MSSIIMEAKGLPVDKRLSKISDILFLFAVFFLPLVFFGAADDPFWGVEKFMLKACAAMLLTAAGIKAAAGGFARTVKTSYGRFFAAFIIINILGIFKIYNFYAFADKLALNISYIIIFCFSAEYVLRSPGNYRKLIITASASAFIMALYGVLQSAGMDFVPWRTTFSGRSASTLGNPNFLAGHMVLIIPVLFSLLLAPGSRKSAAFYFAASAAAVAALFFSQTRGAYLAFAAEIFIFIIIAGGKFRGIAPGKKKLAAAAAILLIITGTVYFSSNSGVRQRIKNIITMKDDAARIRLSLWKNTMYMIRDNPLLGSGAGNFRIKYSYYQYRSLKPEQYAESDFYKSGHAHNDFLQLCAEYGIPGAGIFIYIIIIFFRGAPLRIKREECDALVSAGIAAGIAGMFVHGIFNFPLLIVPTASYFFIFMGAESAKDEKTEVIEYSGGKVKTAGAVLAASAAALCVLFIILLASNVYLRKAKESGHFKRASDAYKYSKKAVSLNPWNEENYYYNAVFAADNGAVDAALESLKKGYALNPGHWEINNDYFNGLMLKGRKEESLEVGKNIYKMSPYSSKAITYAGYAYFLNGKYGEAEKIYTDAIKIKGETYELIYQLSAVYGASDRTELALEYGKKAMALSDNNAGAYYNVAVAYYKMGKTGEARRTINEMLKKYPDDKNALGLKKVLENEKK